LQTPGDHRQCTPGLAPEHKVSPLLTGHQDSYRNASKAWRLCHLGELEGSVVSMVTRLTIVLWL
jgi:hypothetical protein